MDNKTGQLHEYHRLSAVSSILKSGFCCGFAWILHVYGGAEALGLSSSKVPKSKVLVHGLRERDRIKQTKLDNTQVDAL